MGRIELKLDLVMADRRMSLNELADRIGISNVNLSKIKNNKVTAVRFSTLAGHLRGAEVRARRHPEVCGRGVISFPLFSRH